MSTERSSTRCREEMADGRDDVAELEVETLAVLLLDDEWICETLPEDGTTKLYKFCQGFWN